MMNKSQVSVFANTCSSRNSGQGAGLNFSLSMHLPLNCCCLAVCPQLRMLLHIFLNLFVGREFVSPYPSASFISGFDVAESCLCTSRLFQVNLPIDQLSSFMPRGELAIAPCLVSPLRIRCSSTWHLSGFLSYQPAHSFQSGLRWRYVFTFPTVLGGHSFSILNHSQ